MVLLVVLLCTLILLSWVPPVSRDALTHHLAVPKLYLEHGGIFEIPAIGFSYYPMNLDLLYIIPLYFGNDILAKFIHGIFALLTAGLIFGYLAKRLGSVWGLFGALFFLSLPIIVKLSITVYVDLGLVFFFNGLHSQFP
jgi:4-amino-4-deoxy-L-arabinose transferase-like glycosyltransferase